MERPLFLRNLLGLPQTLGQILQATQNPNKPLTGGTLGITNINSDMLAQNKILSDLFEEINPNIATVQQNLPVTTQAKADIVTLMFSGMISMPDISKLILENSKQAQIEQKLNYLKQQIENFYRVESTEDNDKPIDVLLEISKTVDGKEGRKENYKWQ